jgi:hypothetical protein
MLKNIFLHLLFSTILFFGSAAVQAQIPSTLDTNDSGVLKQCATICLRISQLQECKTKTSFHYNDAKMVDGISVSLFDFKTGASLDLNEEKRRALTTVFDEITANIQTDSLVRFVKVEVTQFNKKQEISISKSDFLMMMIKQKVAEKYINSFMNQDYKKCYSMLDPSIRQIFTDTLFYKSCNDIVLPRGPFKTFEFIYFDEKVIGYENEEYWVLAFHQTFAYDDAIAKYTIRKIDGNNFIFGYEVN